MLKEQANNKEVRLRTDFFSCPSVKRHVGCGAYSIMEGLKTGLPRVLDALHEWRTCFQTPCVGRLFPFFFLFPVFSLQIITQQYLTKKEGRAAACLEFRSIMIFLLCLCTGSLEWVLLACCTPPSSCISRGRAPSAPTATSLYCAVKLVSRG